MFKSTLLVLASLQLAVAGTAATHLIKPTKVCDVDGSAATTDALVKDFVEAVANVEKCDARTFTDTFKLGTEGACLVSTPAADNKTVAKGLAFKWNASDFPGLEVTSIALHVDGSGECGQVVVNGLNVDDFTCEAAPTEEQMIADVKGSAKADKNTATFSPALHLGAAKWVYVTADCPLKAADGTVVTLTSTGDNADSSSTDPAPSGAAAIVATASFAIGAVTLLAL